jgi:hypothetical protein
MVTLTLALAASGATRLAQAQADWDVVLSGRSFHVNAEKPWNEDNWGLGFEREFNGSGRWVRVALANGFKDSLGEPSYMAGGGLKRRFRVRSEGFYVDVGAIGFLMTRQDVHHNQPFPGVLPAMTIGSRRVALNVTYLPGSVVDHVTKSKLRDPNMDGVFFLQLKLDASLFGFGGKRGGLLADTARE